MHQERLRITFDAALPLEDIAASLLLARWATESLHGEAVVVLEARHHLDARHHTCVVETNHPAGRDLVRMFVGFLRREFKPSQYRVERLAPDSPEPAAV